MVAGGHVRRIAREGADLVLNYRKAHTEARAVADAVNGVLTRREASEGVPAAASIR